MLVCLTAGCAGPRPSIRQTHLMPPATPGQPYLLQVTIHNQGGGEGEAEMTVRLRSRSTGETVATENRGVALKEQETVSLVIPLQAARPGDYEPVVEVEYPPE